MKNFKINSIINFLFRPKHPENSEEAAIYLFSSQIVGKHWHYVKFVPCNRYGMFPVFGAFTEEEIQEYDKKQLLKKEAAMQKYIESLKGQLESMGLDAKSFSFVAPGMDLKKELAKDSDKDIKNVIDLFGSKISKDKLN